MGFALSKVAAELGAEVVLIAGPVSLETPSGVRRIDVISAFEMQKQVKNECTSSDILIFAAAVADFAPLSFYPGKIKKSKENENFSIPLKRTVDILHSVGREKKANQILVGFALESSDELENAWKKLKRKNCDIIVLNSANKENSGFQGDLNTITILKKNGAQKSFPTLSKEKCAQVIFKEILAGDF